MKIREIYDFIDSVAPYSTQLEWDNSGLMCGDINGETETVMVCLDCTNEVIEQAIEEEGCKLIICHHPLIFSPLKTIEAGTPVYNAIKNGITVISAHTNLDMADGGVNDALCEELELKNVQKLFADGVPLMRMGEAEEQPAVPFAAYVARRLRCFAPVYDSGRAVKKVAVCGGAGGEYIADAFNAGCDTFITGEAKHHECLEAKRLGINLIIPGHFSTEVVVLTKLCYKILCAFPELRTQIARGENPFTTVV